MSSYIYSSSRIKAVENELVSSVDFERLLSLSKGSDLIKAIKDTYLGKFLVDDTVEGVFQALELSLQSNKKLLIEIAPDQELLDLFWIRYDVHNLKVVLRAVKSGLTFREIENILSRLGRISPERIFNSVSTGKLEVLEPELVTSYEKALKEVNDHNIAGADREIDFGYFNLLKRLAEESKNQLITDFVRLQIDLYNLKTRLRLMHTPRLDGEKYFIDKGSFTFAEIETREQVIEKLSKMGNESFWKEAIDIYINEGHSTLLDTKFDDYLFVWLKSLNQDVFSGATLLTYWLKSQNLNHSIQAILVGKEGGQSDLVIRKQLRNIYV